MLDRRDFMGAAAAASIAPAALGRTAPSYGGTVSIIDLYHGARQEPAAAKTAGVTAIIHKASQGASINDVRYHDRKQSAKALGLLWGSFHFGTDEPVARQIDNYINFARIEPDEVACLDFEDHHGHEMSLDSAHEFVTGVFKAIKRYPMIYGGNWLRTQVGNNPDTLLAKCPLWYRRYAPQPIALPRQIWADYTLWQYTDGADYGGPPSTVNGMTTDRSHFRGTDAELVKAWPFTGN